MIALDIEHFRQRVLEDALRQASADNWRSRANTLEAARHRPGVDYAGQATLDELRSRWVELTNSALACRRHADVLESGEPHADLTADILEAMRAPIA